MYWWHKQTVEENIRAGHGGERYQFLGLGFFLLFFLFFFYSARNLFAFQIDFYLILVKKVALSSWGSDG